MKKRLEEIEKNMKSILQEIDKKYENIEISFWPTRKEPLAITIWDGKQHANIIDGESWDCWFKKSQFIEWVERRKILFQKFDKIL